MKRVLTCVLALLLVGLSACNNTTPAEDTSPTPEHNVPDGTDAVDVLDYQEIASGFWLALADADYTAALEYMAPDLLAAYPTAEALEGLWTPVLDQLGGINSYGELTPNQGANSTSFTVPVEFTLLSMGIQIAVTDGGVEGFWVVTPPEEDQAGEPRPLPDGVGEIPLTVNAEGDYPLDALLTYPLDTEGPIPAAVLVHGSGPQDMDETAYGLKPFRDIAWGLAQQGIAVLRYDKVTYSHPTVFETRSFTFDSETVDDAVYARELLDSLAEFDFTAVYVIGHSQGGSMAPKIAELGGYDGMILLAGSPTSYVEVLHDQYLYLAEYQYSIGAIADEAEYQAACAQVEEMYAQAKEAMAGKDEDAELFGTPMTVGYVRSMDNDPPEVYIQRSDKSILILQGTADYQITVERDYNRYLEITQGMDNVTAKLYPNLTHLFTYTQAELSTPADYQNLGNAEVEPEVIGDMGAWILANR